LQAVDSFTIRVAAYLPGQVFSFIGEASMAAGQFDCNHGLGV
jgi:hypothetical protein